MSDISSVLATIGGALSAQSTGGSAGLQNFMATLAKQQSERAARDFSREQEMRSQMFTMARDRRQRKHEMDMLQEKQALETKKEDKTYDAVAASIWSWGSKDDKARAAVEGHLRRTMPLTGPDGTAIPIDWNDRETTQGLLSAAAKQGFTLDLAQDIGAEAGQRDLWYNKYTGGTVEAPTGGDAPVVFAQDQQRQQTAENHLNNNRAVLTRLQQEAADLEARKADMTIGEYRAKVLDLAERAGALGGQAASHRSDPLYSKYYARGTQLDLASQALQGDLRTYGETVAERQASRGSDEVGLWDMRRPSTFPGFMEGFGGGENESEEFRDMLSRGPFMGKATEWDEKADYFSSLSSLDAMHLGDSRAAQALRYIQQRRSMAPGTRVNLQDLMLELREAKMSGDQSTASQIEDFIGTLASIDTNEVGRGVALGKGRDASLRSLMQHSARMDRATGLGFPLFANEEEARKALDAHGTPDEGDIGFKTIPEGDIATFVADYVASDTGLERLVTGLTSTLVGPGDRLEPGLAYDQLYKRGMHALKNLGADTRANRFALTRKLQAITGETATFETSGGAVQDIHGYDHTTLESTRNYRSWADALDEEQRASWEESVIKDAFQTGAAQGEVDNLLTSLTARVRGKRQGFRQDWATWFDDVRVWGEEERLRFGPEAAVADELDANVTMYDVFGIFDETLPEFSAFFGDPGRPMDRVYEPDLGGMIGMGKTPRRWAKRGEMLSYVVGDQSFARRAKDSMPRFKGELGPTQNNIINMLGVVDYIRGYDLTEARGDITPGQLDLLGRMQSHLRGLSYMDVMDTLVSVDATGIPIETFGLTPPTEEVQLAATNERSIPLRDRALDIRTERDAIARAERTLAAVEEGSYLDLDPNPEVADYQIATSTVIEAEAERLKKAKERLDVLETAGTLPQIGSSQSVLASLLLGSTGFTDGESLAALLTNVRPTLTGDAQDLLGLEQGPVDPLINEIGAAASGPDVIRQLGNLIEYTESSRLQRQNMGMQATAPITLRPQFIEEGRLAQGEVAERVGIIAQEIARVHASNGEFGLKDLGSATAARLNGTDFAELAKNAGDTSTQYMLALKVWAATELLK
jgi:hypothetical protein